jgi:hypothetical protein
MAGLCRCLVVLVLTLASMQTWAGQTWVLWVEAPTGSDQWSVVSIPQPRFKAKGECEKRAQQLNDTEQLLAKIERTTGDARDAFSCLPDIVDPRPERALR